LYALMDPLVQWLIQRRLEDGRLPRGSVTEIQEIAGNGQPCDGCGAIISKAQRAVSGIAVESWRSLRLHVDCFEVWEAERSESETQRD
jgi:hypothetical protein